MNLTHSMTAAVLAAAAALGASNAYAVNFTPTTTSDLPISGLGVVNALGQITNQGNAITLRSAVIASNAVAGADTITLGVGTYTLTLAGSDNNSLGGDLDINGSLTINGVNAPSTTIRMVPPGPAGDYKVIGVNQDGTFNGLSVAINGVTITGGRNDFPSIGNFQETGGGVDVYMTGTGNSFSMSNCVITGNSCLGSAQSHGGGVNIDSTGSATAAGPSVGTATLINCNITNNIADREGGGLGLFGDKHDVLLSSCTISGNRTNLAAANGGGVIIQHAWGGLVSMNFGSVTGNAAGGIGGGIAVAGNSSSNITNVTIANNSSASTGGGQSAGGGVAYIQTGALGVASSAALSGCTITGNSATGATLGRGGGVYFSSAYPATVSRCVFTSNSASVAGGGVAMNTTGGPTLTLNFNRIVANTGPAPTGLASIAAMNAENNWWGSNAPGAAQVSAAADFNPWMQLRISAGAGSVVMGGTTSVTSDLSRNSDNIAQAVANLTAIAGVPVSFGAVLGTITGAPATLASTATAAATFNAGNSTGPGSASTTVDGVTVSTPITVTCPTITASVSGGGTVCAGTSASVSVNISGGAPPYTVTLNNSGGTLTGPSPIVFNLAPGATTTYAISTATDSRACPASVSGSATITVVPLPAAPTAAAATPPFVCPGGATVLSASVGGGQTVEWRVGSCTGTLVPGGATPTVSPTATTTYFAQARTTVGGCPSTTCASVTVTICRADFNCSGTLGVQDIFDFLAAWFANDPRANFNGVGGVSVQDIFDFLAAWFAGC